MLDVYMLALLVALVKLAQLGHLGFEMGAYCFVALFAALILVGASYDREALWERVEELFLCRWSLPRARKHLFQLRDLTCRDNDASGRHII